MALCQSLSLGAHLLLPVLGAAQRVSSQRTGSQCCVTWQGLQGGGLFGQVKIVCTGSGMGQVKAQPAKRGDRFRPVLTGLCDA